MEQSELDLTYTFFSLPRSFLLLQQRRNFAVGFLEYSISCKLLTSLLFVGLEISYRRTLLRLGNLG